VNKHIVNYAQMKTIFTFTFVHSGQFLDPRLLIKAIDYLAESTTKGDDYAKIKISERRVSLRTWLCGQFDYCCFFVAHLLSMVFMIW
jgi:hypothetical protein